MTGTATKARLAAAAAVLLAACWQSYQDQPDGGADGTGDIDASACDAAWRDPTTGYLWENPPPDGPMNWDDAFGYCSGLELCGYGAGGWHLPTISELRSLIRGCPDTMTGDTCGVTDSCVARSCYGIACRGCANLGGPGSGGNYWDPGLGGSCSGHWSSSFFADYPEVWTVFFGTGRVVSSAVNNMDCVRCVRRDR